MFLGLTNAATKTTYGCCWKVFLMFKSGPGFIVSLDYSLINYGGYKTTYIMTYI